jgi:hypothetical protein
MGKTQTVSEEMDTKVKNITLAIAQQKWTYEMQPLQNNQVTQMKHVSQNSLPSETKMVKNQITVPKNKTM